MRSAQAPLAAACTCGLTVMFASSAASAQGVPQIRWGDDITCMNDDRGAPIRVQCDEASKVCLFSRACEPYDTNAGVSCEAQERLQYCSPAGSPQAFADLKAAGMRFVEARAEAPPGFVRDDRDRVFQTEFDMNKRVWIGGDWAPMLGEGDRHSIGRAAVTAGIHAEWLDYDTRHRSRISVLETQLWINPTSFETTVLSYDDSRESTTPLVRLTTFWPPTRHDVYFNLGFWGQLGRVSIRPRAAPGESHVRVGAMGGTWDLWRGVTMESYVRLRMGGAFDDHYLEEEGTEHRLAATPIGALESDLLLGGGFHRLSIASTLDAPIRWENDEHSPPTLRTDFENEIAYETILIAVNDQPLSLRFAVGGGYRDDLPDPYDGWELSGAAGLRINFWAPGPDPEEVARAIEARTPKSRRYVPGRVP